MKRKTLILQGSGWASKRGLWGWGGYLHSLHPLERGREREVLSPAPPWPLNCKVKNDGKENFKVDFPHVGIEKVRKILISYWNEAARIQEERDRRADETSAAWTWGSRHKYFGVCVRGAVWCIFWVSLFKGPQDPHRRRALCPQFQLQGTSSKYTEFTRV